MRKPPPDVEPAVDAPLTREAVAALLRRSAVPPHACHLYGAHIDDAVVLDHRPDGWVVYYSERGGESTLRRHATEDAACRDLLGRLPMTPRPVAEHRMEEPLPSPRRPLRQGVLTRRAAP